MPTRSGKIVISSPVVCRGLNILSGLPVIHDGRKLNVQPRVRVNAMLWDTSPPPVWVRHTPVSLLLPQPIGLALI